LESDGACHFDCGFLSEFETPAVDFFPVDANFGRGGDAEPSLVSFHGHDGKDDAAINNNLFADFSGEYEHDYLSMMV
jgi:hypothetical protein